MKNLKSLLAMEEPKDIVVEASRLEGVKVTQYAYDKAFAYARLACQHFGRSIECGGYLIAPKGQSGRVAWDAFLARDQTASATDVMIEAREVINAGREIDAMGYRVLGWWHSHGHMSTFHSGIDDNNQRTVLNEIAPVNYEKINEERIVKVNHRFEKGKVVLTDSDGVSYELGYDGKPKNVSGELKVSREKRIGFCYSLVVNDLGLESKPYSEIGTREFCNHCASCHDESHKTKVEISPCEDFALDEEQLMEEVKDRITERSYVSRFFGFGKDKRKNELVVESVENETSVRPWYDCLIGPNSQTGEIYSPGRKFDGSE